MKIEIFSLAFDLKYILYPILYIILGIICYKIVKRVIRKILISNENSKIKNHRLETLISLVQNIIKYIILIIVVISIMATYGVNVTSLIAGLGVTTAIVGLAFQDIAKDLITGFSIVTEGQYEVGDTIEVDGFIGEVVFLGLRTTRILNYKGETKIIANHYMDKIINYSLHNSLAIVDVGVAYEEDQDKVVRVLENLSKELDGKIKDAKGEIKILGINELSDSCIVYRVVLEVETMQHYDVERILRKEIKAAFDKENIKIPYPQIEVHNDK